jgi:hypothetical protein
VKESLISAYHNYRVNGMISNGFLLGDPFLDRAFYLLADVMEPPKTRPEISARLFDSAGEMILEMAANRITSNPGHIAQSLTPYGYRLLGPDRKLILEVNTRRLTNAYITSIKARLFDERGNLRMEPHAHDVMIYGAAVIGLKTPFHKKADGGR